MKFGGTSVATPEGRAAIAARIAESLELGRAVVVVVSAMGRRGAPYATDTLLSLVDGLPADERESDLLASVGEIVSAILIASELRAAGIAATAFTGAEAGILTDGVHGGAAISEIHTGPLYRALEAGLVPVVCGFQGVSREGSLTTLGRGGSDTTACALGVALDAFEVEIYTDVDGVMSADPRVCDGAAVLDTVRADELHQMAMHGSRVVHTPAAELALASGLSVRVRNTYTDHAGTKVADIAAYKPSMVATAVSHVADVTRIRVALRAEEGSFGNMAAQALVYRSMADAGVSLDMFTPVGETLVFSVNKDSVEAVQGVLSRLGLAHEVSAELAKVTLVGAGMHGVPGVMARMASCLADAGVTVLQTADSHTTISVLVGARDAEKAVIALHEGFALGA
ncbi:MAG: aspartate kinase [Actinobacteria bacterium HGW-Actinobacteria-7]|jgi:aspartate kinase|nr:MAG: aspartate kinase [Actinobacteria bacterium HGW-Actinobacteria-7]